MDRFTITLSVYPIGFEEHVTLNILAPIVDQLQRKILYFRRGVEHGDVDDIRKIIERNSSLRIAFGWSFESTKVYKDMMEECCDVIRPLHERAAGNMVSDMRCDWLGFVPFNAFEREILGDMSMYSLIMFNNELVNYQIEVVKFISQHRHFKEHSFLRNNTYRFDYMKSMREDPIALEDAFHYYIDAIQSTSGVSSIPRSFVEEMIGCHFLKHPDTFFELLEFYMIKGNIYNE